MGLKPGLTLNARRKMPMDGGWFTPKEKHKYRCPACHDTGPFHLITWKGKESLKVLDDEVEWGDYWRDHDEPRADIVMSCRDLDPFERDSPNLPHWCGFSGEAPLFLIPLIERMVLAVEEERANRCVCCLRQPKADPEEILLGGQFCPPCFEKCKEGFCEVEQKSHEELLNAFHEEGVNLTKKEEK